MMIEEVSILVVDDVNAMRVQLRELLKQAGFRRITLASNVEEAKRALDQEAYQLILSDWIMTPADGMEFLQYVRRHPEHKNLAFIMVSAENTREKVIQAIQAGIDDYVVKPLTPVQIQNKVFNVLLKKRVFS